MFFCSPVREIENLKKSLIKHRDSVFRFLFRRYAERSSAFFMAYLQKWFNSKTLC